MPPPMMQTSTWTFSCSGPHSGIAAVADQTDSWRGMAVSWRSLETRLQSLFPALVGPALQVRVDRRRAVELRQRARLLRQVLSLPLGDQRVGPGEGVLERAARRQRFLEERAAEVGELRVVGTPERGP